MVIDAVRMVENALRRRPWDERSLTLLVSVLGVDVGTVVFDEGFTDFVH